MSDEAEELFLLEVVIGAIQSHGDPPFLASCTLPAVSCRFLDFPPFVVHYFSSTLVQEIKDKAKQHNVTKDKLAILIKDVLSFSPTRVGLSISLSIYISLPPSLSLSPFSSSSLFLFAYSLSDKNILNISVQFDGGATKKHGALWYHHI